MSTDIDIFFAQYHCISEKITIFAARKSECGQIWLLATTLKNAKMLTKRSSSHGDRFHINVLCFVTAPHSCGALFLSGI